jgi:hypothetical protein
MRHWTSALRVGPSEVKLLVTDWEGNDVLKARFGTTPQHPRAMLTLLEGIALYSGHRLDVVLGADDRCPRWLGSRLLGDEVWPAESQLVEFHVAPRGAGRVPLRGLGDFRELRNRREVL